MLIPHSASHKGTPLHIDKEGWVYIPSSTSTSPSPSKPSPQPIPASALPLGSLRVRWRVCVPSLCSATGMMQAVTKPRPRPEGGKRQRQKALTLGQGMGEGKLSLPVYKTTRMSENMNKSDLLPLGAHAGGAGGDMDPEIDPDALLVHVEDENGDDVDVGVDKDDADDAYDEDKGRSRTAMYDSALYDSRFADNASNLPFGSASNLLLFASAFSQNSDAEIDAEADVEAEAEAEASEDLDAVADPEEDRSSLSPLPLPCRSLTKQTPVSTPTPHSTPVRPAPGPRLGLPAPQYTSQLSADIAGTYTDAMGNYTRSQASTQSSLPLPLPQPPSTSTSASAAAPARATYLLPRHHRPRPLRILSPYSSAPISITRVGRRSLHRLTHKATLAIASETATAAIVTHALALSGLTIGSYLIWLPLLTAAGTIPALSSFLTEASAMTVSSVAAVEFAALLIVKATMRKTKTRSVDGLLGMFLTWAGVSCLGTALVVRFLVHGVKKELDDSTTETFEWVSPQWWTKKWNNLLR